MRRLLALALLLVFTTGAAPQASLPDIEDEVMCVECGTALNVSTSAVADQERAFIRRQIALGKDKQEVKAALVDEFGPGVLADPPSSGFDLAAYLVPALLALLGVVGIGIAARRWRRQASPAAPAGEPLGDEDAARLDAELAAYDRR
ncbi:MAG TPA: cytochrome c-type biogenesis protein CcmH [Solirubrobacteraceae bacterium]|nr:cytochrome c-type biogenesis protein CcmH [Solirubrobacteraceae bacterium]